MKNVTNIKIGERLIPIDDSALEGLKAYLANLNHRYQDEVHQKELVNEAEVRIAEMMQVIIIEGAPSINDKDIERILATMDLSQPQTAHIASLIPDMPATRAMGLHKNSDDQLLGGVCSGISNYLQIDPSLVRIICVLFCLSLWGVFVYLILWVALSAKPLGPYLGKRITRDTENKWLGGVASGVARYFDWNVTIVRIVFASPIIINLATNLIFGLFTWPFFMGSFWVGNFIFHSSITGTFILAYLLLWAILPVESSSTSIAHSFGWLARFFIFLVSGIFIFFFFVVLVPFLILGTAIWPLNNFEWASDWQRYFAYGSLFLFLGVPFLYFLVWIIRRMIGSTSESRALRWSFAILWLLGWASVILFILSTVGGLRAS